jgi:hypothetical protein
MPAPGKDEVFNMEALWVVAKISQHTQKKKCTEKDIDLAEAKRQARWCSLFLSTINCHNQDALIPATAAPGSSLMPRQPPQENAMQPNHRREV